MTFSLALLIITNLIAVIAISVVLLAQTISRSVKLSFTGVLLGLMWWQIAIFIADNSTSNLLLWNTLVFLGPTIATLSFALFIHLLQSFSAPRDGIKHIFENRRLLLALTFVTASVQVLAVVSGKIFTEVSVGSAGQLLFVRGVFYPVYLTSLVVTFLLVMVQLITSFMLSHKESQERAAFRAIMLTVAIAIAYGASTNVMIPILTDSQAYISLGLLTIDILAIGFGLSIIKYRFLDIKGYVFRAFVYSASLLVAALTYIGLAALFSAYLLEGELTVSGLVGLSLITLIVAVSFQPLRARFDHITRRVFFREYYEPQQVLSQVSQMLAGTVDTKVIQQRTKEILVGIFNPTTVKFVLIGQEGEYELLFKRLTKTAITVTESQNLSDVSAVLARKLKKQEVGMVIRLRTKHEDIGFILLGFRRSGATYSAGDRRLLASMADQLAVGLQNALRFEEIERFTQTLQDRVDEKTRKLQQTNDKLRHLDQTKDDFISMASHQLRTPLTSIKGYVSMVLEGDVGTVTPLQKKLLNQAFISSQRMVYLISDLLNVSRLRTGKFVIEPSPTNLAAIAREEVTQLQETAKSRGIQLSVKHTEHFPALMLDETKVRQVVMNFIDNAIYYTPEGGNITVHVTEKPQSFELTVVDDGMGVPKSDQPHLFTKFFRADNARRARPDGTGLGLFMAKKVIMAQGGAIIFKSHEGKGSTFGFTFAKDKVALAPHVKTS